MTADHTGSGGTGPGRAKLAAALALASAIGLSGCGLSGGDASGGPGAGTAAERSSADDRSGLRRFGLGFGAATRGADTPATGPVGGAAPALSPELPGADPSALIAELRDRRSTLPPGDYAALAQAVLVARPSPAAAELQAARLRARARSKNWLPSLGPQISLASAGRLVTTLFVEQTLLDNGRNRAERAYANAEVEAAAVALLAEANDRVRDALDLVLTAQAAQARAAAAEAAEPSLARYADIMQARVQGGISSTLEARMVADSLSELQADRDRDLAAAEAARTELSRMVSGPVTLSAQPLSLAATDPQGAALPDLAARATARLARAEADAGRAGVFPRLTAVASLGSESDVGLGAARDTDIGFGTRDTLRAMEASAAAAEAALAETAEATDRQTAALTARAANLADEATRAAARADATAATLATHVEAQAAGQRSIGDVVGLIERLVDAQRRAATARLEATRAALDLAALRGTLVDGDRL